MKTNTKRKRLRRNLMAHYRRARPTASSGSPVFYCRERGWCVRSRWGLHTHYQSWAAALAGLILIGLDEDNGPTVLGKREMSRIQGFTVPPARHVSVCAPALPFERKAA